jgi:hypothetical protein
VHQTRQTRRQTETHRWREDAKIVGEHGRQGGNLRYSASPADVTRETFAFLGASQLMHAPLDKLQLIGRPLRGLDQLAL